MRGKKQAKAPESVPTSFVACRKRSEEKQARIDICVCCSVSLEKSRNYRTDFPTIDTREEDCCGAHFPPVAQMLLLSESDLQAWRKDYFSASFLPY
jgi:hypothetical protein